MRRSGTGTSPSSVMKAGPIAIPGDTPSPCSTRSGRSLRPSPLIEATGDEIGERRHGALRLGSGGGELDGGAGPGRQHHQSHDRAAGDRGAVLAHGHLGVELPRELDEPGGGAGMEAALVADGDAALDYARGRFGTGSRGLDVAHQCASASSCEATLMYLRPASWAPRTASLSVSVERRLASLISMGRLMPAITSILGRSITEIARLEGVPPNISVKSTTPSPVSTAFTDCRMSWRRCSMSSSGPMQMAAMSRWGPTTCSRAAMNSAANRPWVTMTMPIIECPWWNRRRGRGGARSRRVPARRATPPAAPPDRRSDGDRRYSRWRW